MMPNRVFGKERDGKGPESEKIMPRINIKRTIELFIFSGYFLN